MSLAIAHRLPLWYTKVHLQRPSAYTFFSDSARQLRRNTDGHAWRAAIAAAAAAATARMLHLAWGISTTRNLLAGDNDMVPISSPLTSPLGDAEETNKRGEGVKRLKVQAIKKDIKQVIHSARANTAHNHGLDSDKLIVAEAFVGKGLYLKRLSYHAKGRCSVRKRPSLDEDIWEVRIHFDASEPLERKLSSSDITYLNLVALMEIQGFHAYDYRACPSCVSEFVRQECGEQKLSTIVYQEPVVFDLSEARVFAIDRQGVVFESQGSNSTTSHPPGACTQESKNVNAKLKAVLEEEEEEEGYQGYDVYEGSDASASDKNGQLGSDPYYMCDDEDVDMEEGKR
ncbi:50S ribosomal protein L22 [Hordeum vulgare]|nr:50S ribosomal protein L22 [Hordeum vulgare]